MKGTLIRDSRATRTALLCLLVFTIVLAPRLVWIAATPHWYNIDLAIYSAAGRLVASGVNPYDFSQNPALRNSAFTEQYRRVGFPSTVDQWNQYAAGNLPLSELMFGAIYWIDPSPDAMRLVFAVADSMMTVVMLLVIRRHWQGASELLALLAATLAGLNPLFFLWGTIHPEDKAVQTVLVLALLLITLSSRRTASVVWLAMAGLAAAASIEYKGFGVLFIPALLVWSWRARKLLGSLIVGMSVMLATLLMTLPVLTGLTSVSIRRINSNAFADPTHASIWIYPYRALPILGELKFHILLSIGVAVLVVYFLARRSIGLEEAAGIGCYVVSVVLLLQGSIDRMMIGIVSALVVLGCHRTDWGITVSVIWFVCGVLAMPFFASRHEAEQGLVVLLASGLCVLILALGLPSRLLANPESGDLTAHWPRRLLRSLVSGP